MGDESGELAGQVDVKAEDSMALGIVSPVSSTSPTDDPQSPSPIRTRSRTRALERAASCAPLPPLKEEEVGTSLSSPLTALASG